MEIIIIGAVAAGTSAAAKARRNNEAANITIYEKGSYISYSGCGMPYFIGGEVAEVSPLAPRNAASFKKKYNVEVKIAHEVLQVDAGAKTVLVKNLETGEEFTHKYDKLVLATGADAIKPPVEGIDASNVFFLRTLQDAIDIKEAVNRLKPKTAAVVGSGFIGIEVVESFMHLGIATTLIEAQTKLTPHLDEDMAAFFENEVVAKGVSVKKGSFVTKVVPQGLQLKDGSEVPCDIAVFATGVRPSTAIAKSIGVELGEAGAIKVNTAMQTNIQDVYACGDCIETFNAITGKPNYRPMGSTANKTGRIAGDVLTGGSLRYKGNLSTGIFKFFDTVVAACGLSEGEALAAGYSVQVCHNIKPNKPGYMGADEMVVKAVADVATGRLLGVQIVGGEGVDKRIDVFAALISYKANVDELFHLDLAYAPPFSTTKDVVHYTGMILNNAINRGRPLITSEQLAELGDEVQVVDARSIADFEQKGCVDCAVNIPQESLREGSRQLDKERPTVTYCNKGVTGNAAQNILLNKGFKKVYNLSGGHKFYEATKHKA